MKEFFVKFKSLFNTKLKKLVWFIAILFIGYYILFYTEFENGYVKVILRSKATLNEQGYCVKESRKLSKEELFERAAKDLLEKLYNEAHDSFITNADGEWLNDGNCYFDSKEKAKNIPSCQFYSNGKQFSIDDIVKQIDFNKTQAENMQKIMQDFSIVRPFKEEKILTDDLKLKYSLFLETEQHDFIFIPYSIKFILVGGDEVYFSKFGYSAYALMIQKYFIENDYDFKFKKGTVEYWKNNDRYTYYPITNCGEVQMRYDGKTPKWYHYLLYDMQWKDEWRR